MTFMNTTKLNTRRNEKRLKRILKIALAASFLSPEEKLSFQLYISRTITEIKERGIVSYHALIDYLHDKAKQSIDRAENITPEQRVYWKYQTFLLAELAKMRRCENRGFRLSMPLKKSHLLHLKH